MAVPCDFSSKLPDSICVFNAGEVVGSDILWVVIVRGGSAHTICSWGAENIIKILKTAMVQESGVD